MARNPDADAAVSARSRSSQDEHVARSVGVGLLAGGAHRTAATMRMPVRDCPSPAATEVGWAAKPVRWSAA